jgi:hypothetical protein
MNDITGPAGAAGGTGGTGGVGGQGGGGSGGDSYSIVAGGTAAVTLSSTPTLSNGAPGTSLGNGSTGASGPTVTF